MPEPHRRRDEEDDSRVPDPSDRRLPLCGYAFAAPLNLDGPRRKVQMHAFGEDQIDDVAQQEGKARENEAQCQGGDDVKVQRPALEDIGMRTRLTPSRLAQMPPQADRSNHREGKPVECVLRGPTESRAELRREDEVADTEERREGAPKEKPNPRQGGQVVVELSEDEGGPPRRLMGYGCSLVQRYQPRVWSSSSSASLATFRPRMGSASPRETFARMSGS